MRFLILLVLPTLLLIAACGDDDDDSSTDSGSPTPTLGAEISATATPDPVPTFTAGPTDPPTPVPTRRADVAFDHYGEIAADVLGYLTTNVGTGVPIPVPCPYDAVDAVVDCTVEGFGRIALALKPTPEVTECRALTTPGSVLFATSCNTSDGALWFYQIVE